jgi:hypothetical protein
MRQSMSPSTSGSAIRRRIYPASGSQLSIGYPVPTALNLANLNACATLQHAATVDEFLRAAPSVFSLSVVRVKRQSAAQATANRCRSAAREVAFFAAVDLAGNCGCLGSSQDRRKFACNEPGYPRFHGGGRSCLGSTLPLIGRNVEKGCRPDADGPFSVTFVDDFSISARRSNTLPSALVLLSI